ncbi:MAG: FecR domain-containing protein [Bacteroidales bacterium]|nr:FecR domain-containing protein [Bacteroidales bacterium]
MLQNNKHNTPNSLDPESIRLKMKWNKSKEEIWAEKFASISTPEVKPRKLTLRFMYSGIAAAVLLMLMISFSWMYSKTVVSPIASHMQVELPDGSVVLMNAETKVSYKPLWWYVQREVNLTGEAFFKVKKGKRFAVKSNAAVTSVLGTTFNIYARADGYEVTCLTGKVKVEPRLGINLTVLTPRQKAVVDRKGEIVQQQVEPEQSIAWSRSEFYFTSVQLSKVLEEISRQYGVKIECKGNFDDQYTGNFSKNMPIEQVLNLVCLPFGINFTAVNENQYLISK